jgi:hypothetical protein
VSGIIARYPTSESECQVYHRRNLTRSYSLSVAQLRSGVSLMGPRPGKYTYLPTTYQRLSEILPTCSQMVSGLCLNCRTPLLWMDQPAEWTGTLSRVEFQATSFTIASAEKDLLALDAGLDHLDDIKGRLVARRKLLLHYRAANLSLIAPIRRLPAEILSQVFLQCIPEESIFLAKTAPLVLSQVCRQWREVALSNQLLWNTLTLDPNHSGNPQFAKALVDIWLSMGNH